MFRETYKSYNQSIVPDKELIDEIIALADKNNKVIKIKPYKKIIVVAAALCAVAVLTAVPAFAVHAEPIYQLMYQISPSFAQFFTPVNETAISNDVEMNVLSCFIHEDTMEIYITVKDLTGERFDGSVDLNDSYYINTAFDCSSQCRLIDYDNTDKTATFLITISRWNNQKIDGNKITFGVRELITGKKKYNLNIPIDLSSVKSAEHTQQVDVNGGSFNDKKDMLDSAVVLVPGKAYKEFKVDGVDLTGIGYIDGKLHIQYAVKDFLNKDNHGSFFLVNLNNVHEKNIHAEYSFSFNDYSNNISYDESVFDIPQTELRNYELYCNFSTTSIKVDGPWKVTFTAENKGTYSPIAESEPAAETTSSDSGEKEFEYELEELDPKTKEDYLHKVLNSVDYYNIVSGNIETNMLSGSPSTIKYAVDMNTGEAYQHVKSEDFDEETFADGYFVRTVDNIKGITDTEQAKLKSDDCEDWSDDSKRMEIIDDEDVSGSVPVWHYRINPTNLHYASTVSIFPQELAFGLLYNTDMWEIKAESKYLSRECAILEGSVQTGYLALEDAETFEMTVDKESGIILKLELRGSDGEIYHYTETTEVSFDKVKIKSCNE